MTHSKNTRSIFSEQICDIFDKITIILQDKAVLSGEMSHVIKLCKSDYMCMF